jgi:hypothetical protein
MAGFRIEGNTSANVVEVDASNNLQTSGPGYTSAGVARGGTDTNSASISAFSEIDAGTKNGIRQTLSAEVDLDYRLRVAHDNMVDQELFNYTAQNTGKHTFTFTTLAATIGTGGITTNSGSITTTTTGLTFGTHAMFPVGGTQTTVCETSVAFSAQPNANTVFDFGLFQRGATTAFAPLDGCYFRITSAGVFGVVNSGGVETPTAVFPSALGTGTYAYTNNATNRYLIQANNVSVSFWINNYKYAEIVTPAASNFFCKSLALPWSFRHAIVGGAAGAVFQAVVSDYKVFIRGTQYSDRLSIVGSRVLGSYQGLSGGTMGSLATYPNSTNPTAAAPSNTALTANLPAGLGGQGTVTAAVAAATDGIWGSYQAPAGSSTVQGRRLVIRGVLLDAVNLGAAVATTATTIQFSIAYGHTAVSLATAETASMATATTKAPRRVPLGFMTWAVGAGIGAQSQTGNLLVDFGDSPIYVNPGEFVALVGKFLVGTATASQTIGFIWQPLFGWE